MPGTNYIFRGAASMNCADEFMRLFAKKYKLPGSETNREMTWWGYFQRGFADRESYWYGQILFNATREDDLLSKKSLL